MDSHSRRFRQNGSSTLQLMEAIRPRIPCSIRFLTRRECEKSLAWIQKGSIANQVGFYDLALRDPKSLQHSWKTRVPSPRVSLPDFASIIRFRFCFHVSFCFCFRFLRLLLLLFALRYRFGCSIHLLLMLPISFSASLCVCVALLFLLPFFAVEFSFSFRFSLFISTSSDFVSFRFSSLHFSSL